MRSSLAILGLAAAFFAFVLTVDHYESRGRTLAASPSVATTPVVATAADSIASIPHYQANDLALYQSTPSAILRFPSGPPRGPNLPPPPPPGGGPGPGGGPNSFDIIWILQSLGYISDCGNHTFGTPCWWRSLFNSFLDSIGMGGGSGGGCGSTCGIRSFAAEKMWAPYGDFSIEGNGTNGGGPHNAFSSVGNSVIQDLHFNYLHAALDVSQPLKGGVFLRRMHRSRNMTEGSSFGPGVFCNYDIRLSLDNSASGAYVFDPASLTGWEFGTTAYLGYNDQNENGVPDDQENNPPPNSNVPEGFPSFLGAGCPADEASLGAADVPPLIPNRVGPIRGIWLLDENMNEVTPYGSVKYAELRTWAGEKFLFEIVDDDYGNGDGRGRLIKVTDLAGRAVTITYSYQEDWMFYDDVRYDLEMSGELDGLSEAEIDDLVAAETQNLSQSQKDDLFQYIFAFDSELFWRMNGVTDSFGNHLAIQFSTETVAGAYVITQVTAPSGAVTTYNYDDSVYGDSYFLTHVNHPDGTQSTFQHGHEPISDLATLTIDDVVAPLSGGHRKKTVYLSGIVANANGNVVPTATQLVRLVVNGDNEVSYFNVKDGYARFVYSGGGIAKMLFNAHVGNYTGTGYIRRDAAYLQTGWVLDRENDQPVVRGTLEPTRQFTYFHTTPNQKSVAPNARGSADGTQVRYEYDNQMWTRMENFTDGTFTATFRNKRKQPLRERDRNGNVTRYVYNCNGQLTEKHVGLQEDPANNVSVPSDYIGAASYVYNPSSDIQTAEYAVYRWEYHASGNGANRLAASIDPNGNRTDYEYDGSGRLIKIIEPADDANAARAETVRAYDSAGRLESITDPLGNVTSYVYDNMGRLRSRVYADGTSEQLVYGSSGNATGQIEKTIDRAGVVTKVNYDGAGRKIEQISAYARMDGGSEVLTPEIASSQTWNYLDGSEMVGHHHRDGALTEYGYDYRGRRAQSTIHPSAGEELIRTQYYVNNRLFRSEDPYGRNTYYGYDATDGRLIRTVTATVPEFTLADFDAVMNLTRDLSPNANYIISDNVYDAGGSLVSSFDGRNTETYNEYDSRARQTARLAAKGTVVETRTETVYDAASNVVEVRSPRFFDAGDANGHNQARETWAYTARNLVATHTEAPGTSAAATESFVYDLSGRRIERTDFVGKIWQTHFEDCCGQVTATENPLGHGTISRKNAVGQTIHQASIETYADHTAALDDPVDAQTYREVTTRYDGRGRPIARTTWLVPRGVVDQNNPPIAGLDGIAATEGLTEQYLSDDNLSDGVGLDSGTGIPPVIGGSPISLAAAISKLAEPEASGGAGISFDADAPGSARVSINAAGNISFSIANAAGQSVISGVLKPADSSLITWNCTGKPTTQNLTGYGTVLVAKSINALGHVHKSFSDGAGRTIASHDALDKITTYSYDAAGNRLSVRDPNGVGQDCSYDELGRDVACTDTANVTTTSSYDAEGNKIAATDAKNQTTSYEFDARGRQVKQIDRLAGETLFAYTASGQLQSLTDAEGQVTAYSYDDAGTKLTETYPDHTAGTSPGDAGYGIVTFTPDPTGRTLRKQDQLGDTVTYNYDLAGRLSSRDYRTAANNPAGAIADSDAFTYDAASRMLTANSGRYGNTVTYSYDEAGRKATESLTIAGQTYTTATAYNAAGQVSGYTYPDGADVDRTYTDRGQLHTVSVDSTTIDTRTYDDGGRMSSSVYNNGVSETRTYNNDNTLAGIAFSGAPIGDLAYGWDGNKNKTSESISGTMSGYGFTVGNSGYDDEDRLVNWERDDTNLDQAWDLSLVGDWDSITENTSTQNRTHGAAHELLAAAGQAVTHDTKGNVTVIPSSLTTHASGLSLSWDFDNRLMGADVDNDSTDDVTYQFDALGRRVQRDDGTTSTVFVQSGQQTIADYPSGTAATSPTYTYFYASYVDEPIMRGGAGGLRYYHRNQQYSITALTDGGGTVVERYAYSAYGTPTIMDAAGTTLTTSAENNRYLYTGREYDDDLDLYHYRARMYDSLSGRFCSRDPIGYVDGFSLYRAYFSSSWLDWSGLKRTKTDAQCCAEYSKKRRGRVKGGMVICCQGDYVPCVFFKPSGSKKADDIIDSCGIKHEKDHFDDIRPCLEVRVENQCYRPGWKYPDDVDTEEEKDDFENREECKAYAIELKCLLNKIAQCGSDSECIREVRERIDYIQDDVMKDERNCAQYNNAK